MSDESGLPSLPPVPPWPLPHHRTPDEQRRFDEASRAFRVAMTAALRDGDVVAVSVAKHLLAACPGGLPQTSQLIHFGADPPVPEGREILFRVGTCALRTGDRKFAEQVGLHLRKCHSHDERTGPHGDHLLALACETKDPDRSRRHLDEALSGYETRAVLAPDDLDELNARLKSCARRDAAQTSPGNDSPSPDDRRRTKRRRAAPIHDPKMQPGHVAFVRPEENRGFFQWCRAPEGERRYATSCEFGDKQVCDFAEAVIEALELGEPVNVKDCFKGRDAKRMKRNVRDHLREATGDKPDPLVFRPKRAGTIAWLREAREKFKAYRLPAQLVRVPPPRTAHRSAPNGLPSR